MNLSFIRFLENKKSWFLTDGNINGVMDKKFKDFFYNKINELLLFTIFLIAIFFRLYTNTYHLLMFPDYDGYQYVKIAKYMAKGALVDEAINWTPLFPALIAIFSFLPLPLDQIGSYLNILFGSLTVFPIYFLVRKLLNKEAAIFSVLIYAFHPDIAFVNVQVMSETTYIFMFFIFSWIIAKLIIEERYTFKYGMITGIVGGLIYLGRPEGTLIFITLSALALFNHKTAIRNKLKWFVTNLITFILVIFPYLLFLRSKIGKFVFSGKSRALIPYIKNKMGLTEDFSTYYDIFTYDLSKSLMLIINNIIKAWIIITDNSTLYASIVLILLAFFLFAIKKGKLMFWKVLLFFIFLLLPIIAPLIIDVDHRYLSPTTSVLSVICGIGFYEGYILISKKINLEGLKIVILISITLLLSSWGFYKVYEQFERKGELNIIFKLERLYKRTGLWLKEHIPNDSKIASVSTNYLIAYYAGDLPFINVSKSITEKELLELICSEKNIYLVINYYAVTRYYKDLTYLINPYSQRFKTSFLYGKIVPVYYDSIVDVVVYKCIDRQ